MRTIRNNTFETNSSSTHCVTILSDAEYKNIQNGIGVLDDCNDYFEVSEESAKEFIENSISSNLKYISSREGEIKDKEEFLKKDFSKLTDAEKRSITWNWTDKTEDELRKIVEGQIKYNQDCIAEYKEEIEYYKNVDVAALVKAVKEEVIPNISHIREDDFKPNVPEELTKAVNDYTYGFNNIESFGNGWEDVFEQSRTVDGVTMHVLGYFGYDG